MRSCSFPSEVDWGSVRALIGRVRDGELISDWQEALQDACCLGGSIGAAFKGSPEIMPVYGRPVLTDHDLCEQISEYDPLHGRPTMKGMIDAVLIELLIQLVKRIIDRISQ